MAHSDFLERAAKELLFLIDDDLAVRVPLDEDDEDED
jgi:hypothetical protein